MRGLTSRCRLVHRKTLSLKTKIVLTKEKQERKDSLENRNNRGEKRKEHVLLVISEG